MPNRVNGADQMPYQGIGKDSNRRASRRNRLCEVVRNFRRTETKLSGRLSAALKKAGIKDGMTISTHHHLRNGDALTNQLFDTIQALGVRGIRWYPSASFPCHEHLIQYLEDGTIHHIEGSMNGPLGRFASMGKDARHRDLAIARNALSSRSGWRSAY